MIRILREIRKIIIKNQNYDFLIRREIRKMNKNQNSDNNFNSEKSRKIIFRKSKF